MSKKTKRPEFNTPRAKSAYPKLLVPDTQFDKAGVLSVKLILTPQQVDEIRNNARPIIEEYIDEDIKNTPKGKTLNDKNAARKDGWKLSETPELDSESNETGNILVTFKQKARISFEGKDGKERVVDIHIPLFDSKGKPIPTHDDEGELLSNAPKIYGGSELKVRYQVIPAYIASSKAYYATLRPVAVQVITLVSGQSRNAEGYGFTAEEETSNTTPFNNEESQDEQPESGDEDAAAY